MIKQEDSSANVYGRLNIFVAVLVMITVLTLISFSCKWYRRASGLASNEAGGTDKTQNPSRQSRRLKPNPPQEQRTDLFAHRLAYVHVDTPVS